MFYRLKKKNSVKVEALSTPFQKAVMLIIFFEPVFAAVHFDNKINSFTVHSCLDVCLGPRSPLIITHCTDHTIAVCCDFAFALLPRLQPEAWQSLHSRCVRVAFALHSLYFRVAHLLFVNSLFVATVDCSIATVRCAR